jgi:hypothetical protein
MDKAENAYEPAKRWPSRRGVLAAGLAAGAVVGSGAWRTASAAPMPGWLRKPGSLPYPNVPAGTDTIPQIEHIVVLMQENHSYDNKLGMLFRPGANGFRLGRDGLPTATNPYANGDIQHAFRMPTTCQNGTVTQEWGNSHIQYDNGKLDGFVITSQAESMGYWQQEDQETKWNLPALTYRDANASAPLDMLDLRHPSFAEPPALAQPLVDTDANALVCSTTGPGTIPPPGSVSPPPA